MDINLKDVEQIVRTVLASMQKIILNAMIVNSLQSSMGGGGFLGGLFGGSAGGSTPSGSYNSAASGLQLNAKGGAYASASLSAYSNSIVRSPTYFAFAKGAGLMGEAGPEAIMPLERGPGGRLGVRNNSGAAPQAPAKVVVVFGEAELANALAGAAGEAVTVAHVRNNLGALNGG